MNFLKFGESLTTLIGIKIIFYNMCIIKLISETLNINFLFNKFKTVDAFISK